MLILLESRIGERPRRGCQESGVRFQAHGLARPARSSAMSAYPLATDRFMELLGCRSWVKNRPINVTLRFSR
jgi:hypothetical protein